MTAPPPLDLVVKNVRVVRPRQPTVERLDVGIKDGRFARLAPDIPAGDAREVRDGRGLLGFPGVVDAHTHVGIYAPLATDAETESQAEPEGGRTSPLSALPGGVLTCGVALVLALLLALALVAGVVLVIRRRSSGSR